MNTTFLLNLLTNKTLIYAITILVTVGLTVYLILRYKLTKYQVMIFVLLVVFWSSINIVRAYRKAYAGGALAAGGLGLDGVLTANMAAAYGLISIFVRLPFFGLSDYFKSRKFFIGLALLFVMGSSIMVVIDPSYISLLYSSLALGMGASLLSMFNVIFAETFTAAQAMVSVSILSVAPLLAEFCMSPLQFAATATKPNDYAFMWIVSAILAGAGFVFLLFVKDNKSPVRNFTMAKFKTAITDKRFLVLCLMGVVVSFIRFVAGESNLTPYVKTDIVNMHPLMVAYIGMIYSIFQMVAGVLVGIYLKKKIGVRNTMIMGLFFSLLFTVLASFVTDPTVLFLGYALSGFGYGLTYNVLLGMAMQPFAKDMREITMGIYQTFFAVGIYYGDKIYALILQFFPQKISTTQLYQGTFALISCVTFAAILLCLVMFNKKNRAFMES